jgi:hypothetical protein
MNPKTGKESLPPSRSFLMENTPGTGSAEGGRNLTQVRIVGAQAECEAVAKGLERDGFLRTGFRADKAPDDGLWRCYLVKASPLGGPKEQQA